ncbi:MAG: tetratricopeptide repeat protein [Verrucomicrobiia bacterium]
MKLRQFIPVLVIAAGILAYHNSFTGPFIFDDVHWIPENPVIRHLWPIWDVLSPSSSALINARPAVNFSLAVNYALGGYNVWGYHALNLAIHILAGLTLFGIVRQTLRQPALRERFGAAADGLALAAALIWTVHPLQTESVTYVIQRAESIMGLFYLLTLYCFIRGAASPRPRLWYGLCLGACALGMASKEVMVSAPLMVMLYDRAFVSGSFREAWRRRWPLYLGLSATWILQGFMVVSAGTFANASVMAQHVWGVTWWAYLLTEPGVILYYLRLAAWPYPLCFDYYGWPIAVTGLSILLPTLVIVILLGATAWTCKKNTAWGVLGAWFFLILAPSSSIIPLDSPAFEHRMYLPLAAIVTGVVVVAFVLGKRLLRIQSSSVLGWVACGFVVVPLTVLTIQRNRDYISELTIWQDTVAKCPQNPRAQYNLAVTLWHAGRIGDAIPYYERALRIKPNYAEACNNLGVAWMQTGRLSQAIDCLEQALRLKPDFAEAHNNLANALLQAGRMREAIGHFEQALRFNPNYAEVHYKLGEVLEQTGQAEDAIGHFDQALRLKPDFADAHCDLGIALCRLGKVPEATAHFEQALQIEPQNAQIHYNFGLALELMGRPAAAIGQYDLALRIKPGYAEVHNNLAVSLWRVGRRQEAIGHWEQALRIRPDFAAAHGSLGDALLLAGKPREAMGQYEQALAIQPGAADMQNRLAWQLATLAPAEGGDPAGALALAQRACELTNYRNAEYVDTLAAAYAANGLFDDAVATAQTAIELARIAGQTQLVCDAEARLELYREGLAYHPKSL